MLKVFARLNALRPCGAISGGSQSKITKISASLYHSYDHPEESALQPESQRYRVLNKALTDYVPDLGFQHKAILESSRYFGFPDSFQSLFVNGTMDLIKFHLMKQRIDLQKYLEEGEFKNLQTEQEKLKYLVKKRLLANGPIAKHLNQLQSYLILPPNLPESTKELHQLCDDFRFYSGDCTNDFAWYTKRLSLGSVYVGLELFQAHDHSYEFKNTLKLADEKLDDLENLGELYNSAEDLLFYTIHASINLFKSQASRG